MYLEIQDCSKFKNSSRKIASHRSKPPPTMTPCTHPKRVGSVGGSFCSSSSSSELSFPPASACPPVVSSYMGGLESSCSRHKTKLSSSLLVFVIK